MSTLYKEVYEIVMRVPAARVVTYADVARLIGRPNAARQVGYALAALEEGSEVPWHRVVNAQGKISPRRKGSHELQRILLEDEGIELDAEGVIDLDRFGWTGTT